MRGEGSEVEVRIMNSNKMYGVSWTTLGVMVIRDHTIKGVPTMFWKHNLRKKECEEVEWNVANGCDKDGFKRVLKIPTALGDHHATGVHPCIMTPPVQVDVSPDVSSDTKLKDLIQECMGVAGDEDVSQLLSTFKKYREHQDTITNVLILSEKVTKDQERTNQAKKALQDAVVAANLVLDGVMAAAVVGTSRRTGGSNMGKKRRMRDKWRKERQSELASIYHPSSHTAPSKKLRLDDD